jgi:hypothetical protein
LLSSFIIFNYSHQGGRFREQYYWDSFWIVEGLIESGLYDIVNATLQNFMDELETIGFIPNGGRIYCMINCTMRQLYIDHEDFHRLESISASDVHTGDCSQFRSCDGVKSHLSRCWHDTLSRAATKLFLAVRYL